MNNYTLIHNKCFLEQLVKQTEKRELTFSKGLTMLYMLFALVTPIVALPLGSGRAGLYRQEQRIKRSGEFRYCTSYT